MKVFFPGSGILLQTVGESKKFVSNAAVKGIFTCKPEDTEGRGMKATVNGKDVALFYWKEQLFCVDARCPHMGQLRRVLCLLFIMTP